MAKRRSYSAKDITVLDAMEGVRQHPGMYLGSVDHNGVYQCLKECVDNTIDELKQSHADGGGRALIVVKGDVVTVADNGRGVPVDIVKKTGKSALETVFSRLHAGAKAGEKTAYGKTTIGVHGVGAAVVNALADRFQVWSFRKNKWHTQAYVHGKPQFNRLKREAPLVSLGCGTVVRYKLDKKILDAPLNHDAVKSYCRILTHFNPIAIKLVLDGKGEVYKPRPVADLLAPADKEDVLSPTFTYSGDGVRCVLRWTRSSDADVQTFVAGSPTTGGTHATGFYRVLEAAFAQVFKKAAGKGRDYTLGLSAILDVTIDQPSFEGQAKTRLASKGAGKLVEDTLLKPLAKFIKDNRPKFQEVVDHVKGVGDAILAARETVKLASSVKEKSAGKSQLPIKLMVAPNTTPDKRELFLLEGDSAAGIARMARLPWQEALPLRGKLPNLIRDGRKALTNQEVHDIIRCVGFDPKKPDSRLRAARLFFLADADVDGDHISTLMMALVYRVMPKLFHEGRVYTVLAPLYVAQKRDGTPVYGNTLKDLDKHGKVHHVERLKGWGSCSPELLRTLAFDPKTRNVARIKGPSKRDGREFEFLMGSNSEARKQLMGL